MIRPEWWILYCEFDNIRMKDLTEFNSIQWLPQVTLYYPRLTSLSVVFLSSAFQTAIKLPSCKSDPVWSHRSLYPHPPCQSRTCDHSDIERVPIQKKENAYISMLRVISEYSANVCKPYKQCDIKKIRAGSLRREVGCL